MGIDYTIPHPCPVRELEGELGLRRLAFLGMIRRYLTAHPQLAEGDEIAGRRWTLPVSDGPEESFSTAEVKQAAVRIPKLLDHCRDCPANMDPETDEFGCLGRINYPIGAAFENHVSERIQAVLDRREPEDWPALLGLICRGDGPFDGSPVARLRGMASGRGQRLFELEHAPAFARRGDGINMDRVLHALLGLHSPRSAQSGYAREIPADLIPIYVELSSGLLYESLPEERILTLSKSSETYLQYRWFHRALRLAWKLQHPLLVN